MAIKGKSRSRGAKQVSRGPKPAYVRVKTPLLRRRGVWIAVGAVVGVAAVAGLWYGFAKQAREDRARDLDRRMASAIAEYQAALDPALAGVGQAVPPTGFRAFPSLPEVLDPLERGRRVDEAATASQSIQDAASTASGMLEDIDLNAIVADQGFERLFVVYLFDSRDRMVDGLGLYEQAAKLVGLAAEAPDDARADLVASARGVLQTADRVFTAGYSAYTEARLMADRLDPLGAGGGLLPTGPSG
ncbi:MAG TPA: hypothetical protein VE669_01970 [Actinomycetota bacterium]|jgi:hypothetical protein|nr:hypothetical protein [Actinomycetota bacterium]